MNEVQVWERVLEWGIAQNPELPSNSTISFSKNDISALENTLRQCIPFIKFFNFTSKEFLNKVYPYRKIIPKELRENLVKHFLDRDDRINDKLESKMIKKTSSKGVGIDSTIITSQHVELISKWVDKLEITDEIKNSYEFRIILRGYFVDLLMDSHLKKFHEVCDEKSHSTVSIIKVKDSNEILGGYNPIVWQLNTFGITKDSFIFSFKSDNGIENNILSRVQTEQYAIYNFPNFGPSLVINGYNFYDTSYCMKSSYEKTIRETNNDFSVEVFQIIKD